MYNYIYISIPKTGTNTVHEILGHTTYNHITANTIKNILGEDEYNLKNTFCFIRKPVDLVKSWYSYHKYNQRVPAKEGRLYYPDTIDEWILKYKCKTHWEEAHHKQNNKLWDTDVSPLHQHNWISDNSGNIIVKEIYKFDDINVVLQNKFNKTPNHQNKSDKSTLELGDDAIQEIYKLFSKDMYLYNNL